MFNIYNKYKTRGHALTKAAFKVQLAEHYTRNAGSRRSIPSRGPKSCIFHIGSLLGFKNCLILTQKFSLSNVNSTTSKRWFQQTGTAHEK